MCTLGSVPLACLLALGSLGGVSFAHDSSADEVRAIVAEMLADAEQRSSLVGTGSSSAGPGGFVVASGDDAFRLRVGGYAQFRYIANFRDDEGGAVDDFQSGFTIQRTRLVFSGRAHDRVDFLLLPFAGPNGTWSIIDAWARFELSDTLKLRVGQFKLPFWREWLISERFNFAVERSELTAVYASIYGQGVQLEFQNDDVRVHAAFSDGIRSLNSDFTSPAEADYAFTARAELLVDGTWAQFADSTSLGNTEAGLLLGFGAHYQGETENLRGVELDREFQITADVSYEGTDWSAMVAGVARWLDPAGAPTEETYGLLAQGGLFVSDDVELIAQYEVLVPDDDAVGDDPFNAVTVGVNWYVRGHALKFTADVIYFIDDTNGTTIVGFGQDNATGLFPTADSGEVSLRVQLQFIF
ncbi:MAG: hypothetical protein Tsb0013_03820 [Phycisphaerales bacterium]